MDEVSPSWQKNFYAVVIAQFVVTIGFNFVIPFLPLFIQEIGDFTDREAVFWAGIATGVGGLASFFVSPLWGAVADRLGRKPMVLRAMFGSGVVVALIGLSPNIYYLIGLRFAQGVLSGVTAATSALVAGITPRKRIPFAMGLLLVATFSGSTIGPLLGGVVADSLGFKNTFFLTGGLLVAGGFTVLFLVQEHFDKTQRGQRASVTSVWRLATSRDILPLLIALCALQAGTQVLAPVIPLFIKTLEPEAEAATASGIAFALMGALAAITAVAAGRLGTRISLKNILVFSCIGTALLHLPPVWAGTATQLIVFTVLTGTLKGGFMTSTNALVGLSVAGNQQGMAYGLAQSAQALGNGLGPLAGGGIAALLGFRAVFPITAALFFLVGVLVNKLLTTRPQDKA